MQREGLGDLEFTLATRTEVPKERIGEALKELDRAGLIDPARLKGPDPSTRSPPSLNEVGTPEGLGTAGVDSYAYVASLLGIEFIAFRRGTTAAQASAR